MKMNRYILFILIWFTISCTNSPKEVISENEFYVCSMDPQVLEKQMGMCPICKMPLAKVTIDKSSLHLIKLSDEQIKLGNIKTDTVKIDSIWNEKTLTGVFAINQNLQQQISSRIHGRIEKLYFKIPGQEIKVGDLLYEIYSRDFMLIQEEFLFVLKNTGFSGNSTENNLIQSAKNKLLLFGMTDSQINKLEEEKLSKIVTPIFSTIAGTITEIPFREGDYIDEGSTLFKITDLTSLWVEAQAYSDEITFQNKDCKLEIIPEAYPEEIMEGEIDFTLPELQFSTKINLIRIKVPNSRKLFLPGMMAVVNVKSKPKPAMTLPIDAVIQNGKKSHVWMQNPDGSFEARQVHTGIQTKTKIEILSGIKTGEVVVTSGAYLIYSDFVFKRGTYPL